MMGENEIETGDNAQDGREGELGGFYVPGGNKGFELLRHIKYLHEVEVFPFIAHFPSEKKALGQEMEQTLRDMIKVAKTSNAYCYNGDYASKLEFYRQLDGQKEYFAELVLEAATPYERLRKNRCFKERDYEKWLAYKGLNEGDNSAFARFKASCLAPCAEGYERRHCFVNKNFRREFAAESPDFKLLLGMVHSLVGHCSQKQTCFCIDEKRATRWQERIKTIGCLIGGLIGAATKGANIQKSRQEKRQAEKREKELAALAEAVALRLYHLWTVGVLAETAQKPRKSKKEVIEGRQPALF